MQIHVRKNIRFTYLYLIYLEIYSIFFHLIDVSYITRTKLNLFFSYFNN